MPIDIGTGALHSSSRDVLIPGRIPLSWSRSYNSALAGESGSHLGPGWTSPAFAKLTRIGKDYHFRTPSGAVIQFPDPKDTVEREGTVRDPGSFHEIARQGLRLRITHWTAGGTVTRFFFQPDRNGQWWPLRSMEDPAGDGLEFSWDEQGKLKGLRQKREKRTLAVTYSDAGLITLISFRHRDGRQRTLVRYEYEGSGRLAAAYDANGFADRFEYDRTGKLVREIAKDGGVFTYKYDDQSRCVRSSGQANYDLKVLRYLDHASMTEVTDSLGRKNRYRVSPTGQILMHLDPLGAKTETEYDELGRVIGKTGPMGEKTSFEYDGAGNRNKVIDPKGQVWSTEFDAQHQIIRQVDAAGGKWDRIYDSVNRPVLATDPLGNESRIEYDEAGNPVRATLPNGAVSQREFSPYGDLVSETDFEGHKTVFARDEFGRISSRTEPDGRVTKYQYDALGQTTQVAYDAGKKISYEYDAAGNLLRISGNAPAPIEYRFGPCRRVLEKRYGGGKTVRYAWGSEPDLLESVTNEAGEVYRFQYDACDRIVSETGFDGRVTRFKFNPSGRCIGRINNLGESIEWELDELGRIARETLKDQAPSEFQYDPVGNLLKASNAWGSLEFERDAVGRILVERQNGFALTRSYGANSEVLELKSDAGTAFGFAYDGNGLVKSVDADGLGAFTFSRNARGNPEELDLPGGLKLKQYFDSRDRLLRQTLGGNGAAATGSAIEREYTYSEDQGLNAITDSRWGKVRYAHDEARRLIQFVSEGSRIDYPLDPNGDPVSLLLDGATEIPRSYGPGGELRTQGHFRFQYDGAGRLISKRDARESDPGKAWQYRWDAKNRLLAVITPAGATWEYGYDPFGRRCFKKGPDREIRFIWDQDNLLHEIESGKETRTWGFEPNTFKPLFRIQGGKLHSIVRDHLGTPRELVDDQGKVAWSALFDPWGNPIKGQGSLPECPLRFQGQYYDEESGFHYNRYRYYDPNTGRYISQDPVRLSGGLSQYQYGPNPIHWIDPLGLCGEEEEEPDVLYRTMSERHYKRFLREGKMPATGETVTSPTEAESQKYDGVLVKFTLKPGTIDKLEAIGVRDEKHDLTGQTYPDMPLMRDARNWSQNNAFFKQENDQINIGLGKGKALDTFNENITGHEIVPRK